MNCNVINVCLIAIQIIVIIDNEYTILYLSPLCAGSDFRGTFVTPEQRASSISLIYCQGA